MKHFLLISSVCLLANCYRSSDAADFDELLRRLPADTNAVLAIDVERVNKSPYVRLRDGDLKNPPLNLPENTSKLLVGAKLDTSRSFGRSWEIGVIDASKDVSIEEVVRTENGELDTIDGKPAAWLSNDSYCVQLSPRQLGLMYPADRQAFSRWVSSGASETTLVTEQISRISELLDAGPQIALALDLRGVPQPHRLKSRLAENELLKKHAIELNDAVEMMSGIRGVMLDVTLTNRLDGILRVDFDSAMTLTPKAGRDFLLQALSSLDLEIPGLEDWHATMTSHALQLEGALSSAAMRRILSLVEPPNPDFDPASDADTAAPSEPDVAAISKDYFDSVSTLVDDLETTSAKYKNDSVWFDRYADKIDRLPILHVDPELVDFGLKTAETLREMSYRRKTNRARTGQQNSRLRASGSGTDYGYTNRYGVRSSYYDQDVDAGRAVTANQSISNSQNAITRIEGFKLIQDAESEIRRTMTTRYEIEF